VPHISQSLDLRCDLVVDPCFHGDDETDVIEYARRGNFSSQRQRFVIEEIVKYLGELRDAFTAIPCADGVQTALLLMTAPQYVTQVKLRSDDPSLASSLLANAILIHPFTATCVKVSLN
jgi:hypothetical protein